MKIPTMGMIIDAPETLYIEKDSSLALLLEASRREYVIYCMQQSDLYLLDGKVYAHATLLPDQTDTNKAIVSHLINAPKQTLTLDTLDWLLMRKDPPVDANYMYTTHLLSLLETQGVHIINPPKALRDTHEKLSISGFPDCCVPTLVSSCLKQLREFINTQVTVVIKPLNGMGGAGILRLHRDDVNCNSALELLTQQGTFPIMAQRFIPEIESGDKRILLINGQPIPYALARMPAPGECRGNLAAGGHGVALPLTARDRWICRQIAPALSQKGLFFVGIDVIGDYLTEINVTSPTGIHELDKACQLNISEQLFDAMEKIYPVD